MVIFTSRYVNKGLATWAGVKVGITVGNPRWKLPYAVVRLLLLAPPNASCTVGWTRRHFEWLTSKQLTR